MPRRSRRTFTPAFKARGFLELLSGRYSSAKLCCEPLLSPSLLTASKDTARSAFPSLVQGGGAQPGAGTPRRV